MNLKTIWDWLVKSSANPQAVSRATVGTLGLGVAFFASNVVPYLKLVCEPTHLCALTDPMLLATINNGIELLGQVIVAALTLVSAFMALTGWFRKFARTFNGTNAVITSNRRV